MAEDGPHSPLNQAEDDPDSLLDQVVGLLDIPMLILALVSLTLIIVEFTVSLTPSQSHIVSIVQLIIWGIFVLEYALRVFLAEHRLQYLRKNWFDALIVLLPSLRIIRVGRALRALRLLRVVHPAALARAFFTTRRTLRKLAATLGRSSFQYVLLTTAIVITLGSTGTLIFERNAPGSNIATYGDALWYVVGVVTTVGNQLYPVTTEGRIIAVVLMIYGVGIFGYLAGTLASYFVHAGEPEPGAFPSPPAQTPTDREE